MQGIPLGGGLQPRHQGLHGSETAGWGLPQARQRRWGSSELQATFGLSLQHSHPSQQDVPIQGMLYCTGPSPEHWHTSCTDLPFGDAFGDVNARLRSLESVMLTLTTCLSQAYSALYSFYAL